MHISTVVWGTLLPRTRTYASMSTHAHTYARRHIHTHPCTHARTLTHIGSMRAKSYAVYVRMRDTHTHTCVCAYARHTP